MKRVMAVMVAAVLAVMTVPSAAQAAPVGWGLHDTNAGGGVEHVFTWGDVPANCQPITGDWNGDGWDTVGALCPVGAEWSWFMQNQHSGDPTDYWFNWGSSGCIPIVGDWDGNGTDTPGVVCASGGEWQWTMWNHNAGGGISYQFNWGGNDGCWPIDGDWNGDGADSPGLLCPRGAEWEWVMSNYNAPAGVDAQFRWGGNACPARWGDWDGNNTDTPAVVCNASGGELEWTQWNYNAGGGVSNVFRWGGSAHKPLVGDWNNDGYDTVGSTDMGAATQPPPSPGAICPLPGFVSFDNNFGVGGHEGVDMFAPFRTPTLAVMNGTVVAFGYGSKPGNYVKILGADGIFYRYHHHDSNAAGLYVGMPVAKGQVLGYLGNTGNSGYPHLHFESRYQNGVVFNAYPALHQWCPGHG